MMIDAVGTTVSVMAWIVVRATSTSTLPRQVARTSRAMTSSVLAMIPVSLKML
jgi:hypothetical protein